MHKFRIHLKRLSLWILLFVQIFVIATYFYAQPRSAEDNEVSGVSFFDSVGNRSNALNVTYHTEYNKYILRAVPTRFNFTDFNTSLCYTNGTDLKSMQRSNDINWKCICLPFWHGSDCGQPEVIWRAFLAYRKSTPGISLRKYQRRLIYAFEVDEFSKTLADIRVNELNETVDLFVLYEVNSRFLKDKLSNRFLKGYHYKILYLNINNVNNLWSMIRKSVPNLRGDDILLTCGNNDIPNKVGISFLKFYDNWPEPINFRLKYSVYGFFWIHPTKTVLNGGASTIRYIDEILNGDLKYLSGKSVSNLSSKNFIIGDLNHYGGWYCEFCNDPSVIINRLKNFTILNNPVNWENVIKIDDAYVENLIEDGVYLDGKTTMIRAHRFRDSYFAPEYVSENSWKYDFLLVNMFSKMDYYD